MSASRNAAPSPGPGGGRPDTASSAAMASTTPSTPTPMPGKRAAPLSLVSSELEAATRSPPALSPRFAEPPSPGILATAMSTPGPSVAASTSTGTTPAGAAVGGGAGAGSRTASVKRRGRTRAPSVTKASSKTSPGLGPSKISPRLATTPSTPVPNMAQPLPPPADQPEFAELLTPAQLRGRRRRAPVTVASMAGLGSLSGQPILPGHSRLGWTTDDGNLYRGAVSDPTADAVRGPDGDDNDEAITDASSSGSSGSSWSWGSGIEHGARATMAVVQRFGHAIGVRRGSHSSGTTATSTVSSSSSSSSSEDGIAGRIGRALNRSVSRNTDGSSPERPRRVYVPRRREFTLLVPPVDEESGIVLPPRPGALPGEGTSVARVVSTPVLAPVLEAVRKARIAAGIGVETPGNVGRRAHHHHHHHHHGKGGGAGPDVPVRRGGSAPGRSRQQSRFAPPPIPRPVISRAQTHSRVDALRGERPFVRPKSASDLLGLTAKPKSASDLQAFKTGSFGSSLNSLTSLTPATSGDDGIPTEPTLPQSPPRPTPRPAWWLDVSCPTWKDLRDIGELLGLHPLTLEDVLHQDPREKLDVYDKLGYYFVVVRALDEQYFKYTPGSPTSPPGAEIAANAVVSVEVPTKERTSRGWGFGRQTGRNASKTGEKVEIVEDNPGQEGLEGVGVGGINLYLVVFADGIVSFHYDDVSKHTTRVRDRVLSPTELLVPTSDWIMHGLLDSIVDAFFPLAGYVDGAVDDMDSLTIDPTRDPRTRERDPLNGTSPAPSDTPYDDSLNHEWLVAEEKMVDEEKEREKEEKEKEEGSGPFSTLRRRLRPKTTTRASPAATAAAATAKNALDVAALKLKQATKKGTASTFDLPRPLLYLKLFFLPTTSARPAHHDKGDVEVFDRSTMLRSITNMRRLVTGLSRLLVGKQGVVLSLLKRAAESRSDSDVEAYLSDVHDHILLLQTSLYHYEYILAQCQPAYLSYLSVSGALSRGGTDIMILALSTVTIGILPMQWVLGLFSMNVHMPVNGHREWHTLDDCDPTERDDCVYAPYNLFGVIVAIIFLIACGVVLLIRYWRWLARKKWTNRRGGDLPSTWEGFWGWA